MDERLRAAIALAAGRSALDPLLLQALVEQESNYRQYAWNPEPRYHYLWDVRARRPFRAITVAEIRSEFPPPDFYAPPGVAPDAEWWGQQTSWGLTQVMGAVARERGFAGDFLTELLDVETNLAYGARHLAGLIAWAERRGASAAADVRLAAALAAYNGGTGGNEPDAAPDRNAAYAHAVLTRFQRISGRTRIGP